MDSAKKSDDQLLDDLRNGAPGAFRRLVEEHQSKVINVCYRFVHEQADAEELAQETFVEVHRSLSGFRGRSSLSTWIYRIAVSKSLDFIRRQSRQKRGGVNRDVEQSREEQLPSPDSDRPDVRLEQKERRRILREALERLPRKQCIAFVLCKYDGMSYGEIADLLGVSRSAVESLIHRARNNLRKILYNYYVKYL